MEPRHFPIPRIIPALNDSPTGILVCSQKWVGGDCTSERTPRFKYLTLSLRDKTLHLTPRAIESGYEHTLPKLLARTLARTF